MKKAQETTQANVTKSKFSLQKVQPFIFHKWLSKPKNHVYVQLSVDHDHVFTVAYCSTLPKNTAGGLALAGPRLSALWEAAMVIQVVILSALKSGLY